MQPDLEYGIFKEPSHNAYEAKGELTLEPQVRGELPGAQRRPTFSPTAWRHILILGDEILFLVLLALVLTFTPHLTLELRVSSYELNPLYLKILWGILAILSWNVALRVTEAQELVSASSRLKSPLHVLFALVLTLIFWIALTYPIIVSGIIYSRALLFFLILAAPILTVWRVTFAEVINLPRFHRQAVIVGVNAAGENIVRELRSARRTSINVQGYISESSDERLQSGGLPVLGGRSTLRHLIRSGMVDMVIMAVDYKASPELFQEAIEAVQLGLSVVPITTFYENVSGKIPVEQIGDQWYMALPSRGILSLLYLCWRKVIDLAFGLLGTVVLLLTLPIVAALIYFDSPGPIFYSQERVGRSGRKFRMHKFRSMRTNAEQIESAAWTAKGDARVTRVGRSLRAIHLDELPQALNILRGEMSLIGPRPEREEYISELERANPLYSCRLSVKPGLTGWAQVNYGYGSGSQDELVKLQYDLYYIKHQSYMLDVVILLKTVVEVILHHGI